MLYPRLLKGYTFSHDMDEYGEQEFLPGKDGANRIINQVVKVSNNLQGEAISQRWRNVCHCYRETSYPGAIWPKQPIRAPFGGACLSLRPGFRVRHCKPMHFASERHQTMLELAKNWLEHNTFVLCGATEWLSATFRLPKKVPGEWRGVVNDRGLSKSLLSTCIACLTSVTSWIAKVLTSVEYHSLEGCIQSNPIAQDPAATYTPIRALRRKCMPQGLKNSSDVSQRMNDRVLGDLRDRDRYIHELIIWKELKEGMTPQEMIQQHDADMRRIRNSMEEFKLVDDWDSTSLFVETVQFCGQ